MTEPHLGEKRNHENKMSYGESPYDIHLEFRRIGKDLLAAVTGGTRAHIGAVCLAEPADRVHPVTGVAIGRTAEAGDGTDSEDASSPPCSRVSVLTSEGHKDAVLAEMFARALCEKYGVNVCCSAGVHVDDASADEIALMVENAKALLKSL